MDRELNRFLRGVSWAMLQLCPMVFVLGLWCTTSRAEIDSSIDRTVWKMIYGVSDTQLSDPAWLTGDDDGDGLNNGAELAAGTNPFSASSTFAVTSTTLSETTVSLGLPTAAGKLYVVQSTNNLADSTSWGPLSPAVQVIGDGKAKTLVAPRGTDHTFYRVVVQNTDTDGDQISDWAEDATGLDPANSHTHGAQLDDHTTLANDLAGETVITITASKASATQPPDASTEATDAGTVTIARGGSLHFSSLTVPLNWTGTAIADTDYEAMPSSVTFAPKVGTITLTLSPKAHASLRTSVVATVYAVAGSSYTLGANSSASIVVNPAGNPSGTGLTGYYFNNKSTSNIGTYSASLFLPANQQSFTTNGVTLPYRIDPGINFNFAGLSPGGTVNASNFTVRWAGQVQPQYSETYYFDTKTDDGVKLWVNGQLLIDGWTYLGPDRIASINLQAGVLYDIKMDYFQGGGGSLAYLYWYSDSQPKQIIPAARLYPDTTQNAPPAITSAPRAVGFVNQPFTFAVTASNSINSPTTFAVSNHSSPLPPGLALNASTGAISGTPTAAGDYPVALTVTNAYGTGASVLDIQILGSGSGVTRELWQSGVAGPAITDIPVNTPPTSSDNTLASLEDNAAYPDNTGERLRGYFTAPATGNYYFWLAANNAAELWISDDAEPVNKIRRAWVAAPGTAAQAWTTSGQTRQRTPWLSLVAGQNYYYEVLHNCGPGSSADNVAVGWLLDPTAQATTPVVSNVGGTTSPAVVGGGVVPGYVLYKYDYPTATTTDGALYVTNLSPQGASVSTANGSVDLRMNSTYTQGVLHFNYSGLTTPRTAYHIHLQDSSGTGAIVFDIDDADRFHPELRTADGGYIWNIADAGTNTAAMIVAGIKAGNAYFNVHTVKYPNGEIRGNLGVVLGSQEAPTPVTDPGYADDHAGDAGAARFLNQAAFGAAPVDMAAVKSGGYAAWIDNQVALPSTHLLPDVQAQIAAVTNTNLSAALVDNAWWRAAVTAPDQLRQRTAFALSEILVVSDNNATIAAHPEGLASYYDTLSDNAFGNFRDLLKAATLHPTMGYWLNMQGNAKGNLATGYHPNENYAREIMQLFSIGLNRLWPDGSLVLDSQGNVVPTYNQDVITNGFARVFTGWTWRQALQGNGQLPTSFSPPADYVNPMVMVKNYHELGAKTLLDNVVLPPAVGYSMTITDAPSGSQADTTSAAYDSYCLQNLDSALDNIFYHPNVGPYVCRQLIQRLVESNPSPGYLARVVQKFNDDGTSAHTRGNMAAVFRAILLDGEARDATAALASTTAGKQREPLLRVVGPGRTFVFAANSGTYSQSGSGVMTITTANPHHFSGSDAIGLDFSVNNTGTPPAAPTNNPTSGTYTVLGTPAPTATAFSVTALGITSTTCNEAANSTTLTVATSGPPVGESVYLKFTTGGFADGVYSVTAVPTNNSFTVTVANAAGATAIPGTVIVPKVTGYDNIAKTTGTTPNTITLATNTNSNVKTGDKVWIVAGTNNQLKDAAWTVASVIDERHFTVTNTTVYANESNVGVTIYPLVPPVLMRSGNVNLPASKFDMGNTNGTIIQTPLDSPTVFNYFYPDYKYPGTLASNNLTTPEFELTTDTNIMTLTNSINTMILSSSNANGLSTFRSGALMLDLSAYMSTDYATVSVGAPTTTGSTVKVVATTSVNASKLITDLGNVLTGGMLTQQTKDAVAALLNDTASFPTTQTFSGTTAAPPVVTYPTTCARDKARAVVQLILASPEYAVQR